jgi:hypothetical protein
MAFAALERRLRENVTQVSPRFRYWGALLLFEVARAAAGLVELAVRCGARTASPKQDAHSADELGPMATRARKPRVRVPLPLLCHRAVTRQAELGAPGDPAVQSGRQDPDRGCRKQNGCQQDNAAAQRATEPY